MQDTDRERQRCQVVRLMGLQRGRLGRGKAGKRASELQREDRGRSEKKGHSVLLHLHPLAIHLGLDAAHMFGHSPTRHSSMMPEPSDGWPNMSRNCFRSSMCCASSMCEVVGSSSRSWHHYSPTERAPFDKTDWQIPSPPPPGDIPICILTLEYIFLSSCPVLGNENLGC